MTLCFENHKEYGVPLETSEERVLKATEPIKISLFFFSNSINIKKIIMNTPSSSVENISASKFKVFALML